MARKIADCRQFPSENGCTLTITGEEAEVMAAAIAHAVTAHHHVDDEELRSWLRANLEDEATVDREQRICASQPPRGQSFPRGVWDTRRDVDHGGDDDC